jgi:hypothetical protein
MREINALRVCSVALRPFVPQARAVFWLGPSAPDRTSKNNPMDALKRHSGGLPHNNHIELKAIRAW